MEKKNGDYGDYIGVTWELYRDYIGIVMKDLTE